MPNILLLSPKSPLSFWNINESARDLCGRKVGLPPLGLITVAAYLPPDFSLKLVDRNIREETDAEWAWADVVFLSVTLFQAADYQLCLERARRAGKPVAVGGPYTHGRREESIAEADWVCFGEAESIIGQLVADIRAGKKGIAYEGGNKTDMSQVLPARFDLLGNINDYHTMTIQFSRGCPFNCEFCDIIEIYGRIPRAKTPSQITQELSMIYDLGFRGVVLLVDDNFIGNKKKVRPLLDDIALWNERHRSPYPFFTEASLNLADDTDLMIRMSRANFRFIFVGIETDDPESLRSYGKLQNVMGDLHERIDRLRQHGLHLLGGFILGFDGEDAEVVDRQRMLIERLGIGIAMVGLLQAVPDTRLWRRLDAEGRLLRQIPVSLNLTNEGMNFIPVTALTKRQYLLELARLNEDLFEPRSFFRRIVPGVLRVRRTQTTPFQPTHLFYLMRLLWWAGVRLRPVRRPFWKALYQVLRSNPRGFGAFFYDCFHYLHLYRTVPAVSAAIHDYLQHPDPADVLDTAIAPSLVEESMKTG